jgi:hypothetical protein
MDSPKMQWKAHCGRKAQLRNLRQVCRKILESKDSAVQIQVERVIEATKTEPMPEFGKLHLIHSALDACDQTGEPWCVCMKYLMDKFEDMAADAAEAAATAPSISESGVRHGMLPGIRARLASTPDSD